MSEFWKLYEGQVVENRFRLRSYLGGSDDSAVFLTQLPDGPSAKAAIKFIPAGPAADQQLSLWRRAKLLSHPNLLKIYETGRCRLENRDRLFVVMEYAEEDLGQILPQRALTDVEARDMLAPVLDALVYLHSNGLAHSRLKPSNILATSDQLKLSTDCLLPIGETRKVSGKFDGHDAPEISSSPITAAADVWSLAVTLVETLTQQTPGVQPGGQADAIVPDDLPQPFLDIARHSLRWEPRRRWTVAEIAARLNPVAVAAAAARAGGSPMAVPLSPPPVVPAVKITAPRQQAPPPRPAPAPLRPSSEPAKPQSQTLVLPNYVVGVAAALFVVVAIIALPKILGHRTDTSSAAATSSPANTPTATPAAPKVDGTPAGKSPAVTEKVNSAKAADKKASVTATPAPSPTPASVRTDTFASANSATSAAPSSSGAKGEVLDQVLPNASDKALATIHGVVRVSVRVHVDPAGNVSGAELDSAGPSQYFANLALEAARKWQFNSPEVGGHSVASEWLIRFHFTPQGPKAMPSQVAP